MGETINAAETAVASNDAQNSETQKRYLLPKKETEKTFELPNGGTCVVKRAKGKHSISAAEIAQSLYGKEPSGVQVMNCILSLVTTIDGEGILPDELGELWAEDYAAIQNAFMDLSGGF